MNGEEGDAGAFANYINSQECTERKAGLFHDLFANWRIYKEAALCLCANGIEVSILFDSLSSDEELSFAVREPAVYGWGLL